MAEFDPKHQEQGAEEDVEKYEGELDEEDLEQAAGGCWVPPPDIDDPGKWLGDDPTWGTPTW